MDFGLDLLSGHELVNCDIISGEETAKIVQQLIEKCLTLNLHPLFIINTVNTR